MSYRLLRSSLLGLAAFTAVGIVPFVSTPSLHAQGAARPAAFDVKAHYTKHEYRIPMRDGVKLFTSVYVPNNADKSYPFLMQRTCYSVAPYGDAYKTSLGAGFQESGYIFVFQDVRGRYASEGVWQEATPHIEHKTGTQHDESTDMYDTVEWLLKNVPNNNGRVGIYGISYPGFYTDASIIDSHPAIKAASPQAPVTDLYDNDDEYHNGAMMFEANDFYLTFPKQKVPMSLKELQAREKDSEAPYVSNDAYAAFMALEPLSLAKSFMKNEYFDDVVDHPTRDAFWESRDISQHLHGVKAAVLTVGGWFDAEDLSGPWKTYRAINQQSPQAENKIVVGPWFHGGWARSDGARIGEAHFGGNQSEYFRTQIQLPFFEHYLKDGPDPKLDKVTVFETGSNKWKSYPSWPPPAAKESMLYFGPNGTLSFTAPKAAEPAVKTVADLSTKSASPEFDEYVSDPKHPVPEVGYIAEPGPEREYMAADQRFATKRSDVLVYQTEPLKEAVTIAGPVRAKLHVSTSGTDSDYIVKLIDVYPVDAQDPDEAAKRKAPRVNDVTTPESPYGGFEQLVRGEPMRGKYRNSFAKPEPFTPGKVEPMNFSLIEVNHTFLPGHRIMVQVQSSWFPLIDLNPQVFEDISKAKAEDFKTATERVYHSAAEPSGLLVQVLK